MVDSLGFRLKLGVIAPSTNTTLQPEIDAMRPVGVTNHFGRIHIPDMQLKGNDDFNRAVEIIRKEIGNTIDRVMTCRPQHLILGMATESFLHGVAGAKELQRQIEERAGVKVSTGSDAVQAALRRYGDIKRIGVVTPYMPVGDEQVKAFFKECGIEVVHLVGLKCQSPVLFAHVSEKELRDALVKVNDSSVEAIFQAGTNLAMARLAGIAEFWLDKPVIAINTATYWHALRTNGITDRVQGFGSLLTEH